MKVAIIEGTLQEFINGQDKGSISIIEPCVSTAIDIADMFLSYGKTIVLEPSEEE